MSLFRKAAYIIRMDDACPTMDHNKWTRVEHILDKYGVKALVAVIPHNDDPKMMIGDEDPLFWNKVTAWQHKGWSIALHGYNHVYDIRNRGIVSDNQYSEFAGHSLDIQRKKIRDGIAIFNKNKIHTNVWIAPAHTFDMITVEALREESPIRIISDGYMFDVIYKEGFHWIPQQLATPRKLPFGLWTFCLHPNTMSEKSFLQLESFLSENSEAVTNVNELTMHHRNESIADQILKWGVFTGRRIKKRMR